MLYIEKISTVNQNCPLTATKLALLVGKSSGIIFHTGLITTDNTEWVSALNVLCHHEVF